MERQTKIDEEVWGVVSFVLTRETHTLQDRSGQGQVV